MNYTEPKPVDPSEDSMINRMNDSPHDQVLIVKKSVPVKTRQQRLKRKN